MRLLLDTNIVLEVLLNQDKTDQVKTLISQVDHHTFNLSDYALHSIGNILIREEKIEIFRNFLEDMIHARILQILSVPREWLTDVAAISEKFNLDFDDAYQYTLAEKHDLTLVSFDADFDKTDRGRKTPADIVS